MMHYISLALFSVLLLSTWLISTHQPDVPQNIHVQIQGQMKNILKQTVHNKHPEAKNIQIIKMDTRSTNKSKQVHVSFAYSFEHQDGTVEKLTGFSLLSAEDDINENWSFDKIQVLSNDLSFPTENINSSDELSSPENPENKSDSDDHS